MTRSNVRISQNHREKLEYLAEQERRSMTGQVEYMIDHWPVNSKSQIHHNPTGEKWKELRLLLLDVIGDFPTGLKSNAVDAACEYLNEGENES